MRSAAERQPADEALDDPVSIGQVGWAAYATDDTFYWVTSLDYGDFPPSPPPDLPNARKIVEGFMSQLPLDR